jgi:hypothetical protein
VRNLEQNHLWAAIAAVENSGRIAPVANAATSKLLKNVAAYFDALVVNEITRASVRKSAFGGKPENIARSELYWF